MRTFDGDMRAALVDQPVDAALTRFGSPTGQYDRNGQTYLVWQRHRSESVTDMFGRDGHTYALGRPMGDGHIMPWSGVVYDSCVLRARTVTGVVKDVTFEGNPGGCEILFGQKKPPLGKRPW